MPAYNSGGTLAQTLDSVLAQTLEDWEIVIVDDGSSDDTGDIADSYAERDPRIRVIHQQNAGCGPARGVAVDNARASLIARLDQDDLYVPTYLEEMAAFVDANPDYEIYSCNGEMFFPDGRTMPFHRDPRYDRVMSLTFEEMAIENGVFSPAVFRKSIYEAAGGFRSGVWAEDYDLWMRAMAAGARHIYLPRILVRYRISEGQMSGDWLRTWESAVFVLTSLRRRTPLTGEQDRMVRAALRHHWRWRAWQAFLTWLPYERKHQEARGSTSYFLSADAFPWWRRFGFFLYVLWVGVPVYLDRAMRTLLSSAIAAARACLPFLRNVRLRKHS